jgi:dihydropteroate synthase
MGIINVTPDSFSDGGQNFLPEKAIQYALQLMEDGADILDIGGESTRPNAHIITPNEEQRRVIPVIRAVKSQAQQRGIKISVDTRNATTMRAALDSGADIINDVSALTHDANSLAIAAASNAQIILMHMQGTPQTMQNNPVYKNVVQDVFEYLEQRIIICVAAGISKSRIIADPGLGFGKTVDHNVALLTHVHEFQKLGVPVLIGASRKSFLAKLAGLNNEQSRLPASLAAAITATQQGAQILRVHDVAQTLQMLRVWQGLHHIDKGS